MTQEWIATPDYRIAMTVVGKAQDKPKLKYAKAGLGDFTTSGTFGKTSIKDKSLQLPLQLQKR